MAFPVEDRLPLLNVDDSKEESSSGYDSPVFVSDSESALSSSTGSCGDSEDNNSSSLSSDDSSSDDESDDLDDIEDPDTVNVSSTATLIDNIKYILSMPELCDITFQVGPQLIPVHGLKAVICSRSQVLQNIILQNNQTGHRETKKRDSRTNNNNVPINNYDIDVFRQFIYFLHTGSVVMDITTVIGLTCAATEFDVVDLTNACWGYLKHCITTPTNISILQNEADKYGNHNVVDDIIFMLAEARRKNASPRKETIV